MVAEHVDPSGIEFFAQVDRYLSAKDQAKVRDAFEVAKVQHGEERRKSGELFFTHPLTVATYLSTYYLDASALVAALLHDVAEDTNMSVEAICQQFGEEVGQIVDGLTKFDRVTAKAKLGRELTPEEVKEATTFKLFDMMTSDMRIGIVKIFDRLHNMRTIRATPPHKQKIKARETLSIYAPLANRLGMWKVKNELQSISFGILNPERYGMLCYLLAEREQRYKEIYQNFSDEVNRLLRGAGLSVVDVFPAEGDIESQYNILAHEEHGDAYIRDAQPNLVVLLKRTEECYNALYHIHTTWRPVRDQMKDYIGAPRTNLYRSLHTAVVYRGVPLKIQLRTENMQIESQLGVLSRWQSKKRPDVWSVESRQRVDDMLNNISVSIKEEVEELGEGVRRVIDDFFTNQIIVYTPEGDKKELPAGATPIDFAYKVHTAVGHSCRGATVDNKQVPLTYKLKDGQIVNIKRHGKEPQRSWLDDSLEYVQTTTAKAALRRWFRNLPELRAITQGKRLLVKELGMLNESDYPHRKVGKWFGYESEDDLYFALGRAEILPTEVGTKILTENWTLLPQVPDEQVADTVRTPQGELIMVEGGGGRELRLCRICDPRPGDEVTGFIRRDEVVTMHRIGCRTLSADDMRDGRSLRLRWREDGREEQTQGRPVTIQVSVHDRSDLLHDITHMMHEEQVNIMAVCASSRDHRASIVLSVAAHSPRQVVSLLHRIQALVNVIKVCYLGESVPTNGVSSAQICCHHATLHEAEHRTPIPYLNGSGKPKQFVAK